MWQRSAGLGGLKPNSSSINKCFNPLLCFLFLIPPCFTLLSISRSSLCRFFFTDIRRFILPSHVVVLQRSGSLIESCYHSLNSLYLLFSQYFYISSSFLSRFGPHSLYGQSSSVSARFNCPFRFPKKTVLFVHVVLDFFGLAPTNRNCECTRRSDVYRVLELSLCVESILVLTSDS